MNYLDLHWAQYVVDKIYQKHNLTPEEVEEVIYEDVPVFRKGPGAGKNCRYYILGKTVAGRYLLVVLRREYGQVFSIITARDMKDNERKSYKK